MGPIYALGILYVATCDLCVYEFHDTVFLRLYVGMCYLKRGNMTSTCVSYFMFVNLYVHIS